MRRQEYSEKVKFVTLRGGVGTTDFLWPCVVFESKAELLEASSDFLPKIHHQAISGNLRRELKEHTSNQTSNANTTLAYLLGTNGIPSNKRLLFDPELCDFSSWLKDVKLTSSDHPGYKEALSEGLQLFFGPECSITRLRFAQFRDDFRKVLWPCMIFNNFQDFFQLLKGSGVLSTKDAEVDFSHQPPVH